MSDVGSMVAELIAAGCAPEVAAKVVANAFVAGAASGGYRVETTDATQERRRAWDREYRRKKREQEIMSGGCRVDKSGSRVDESGREIESDIHPMSGGIHPTPPDVANTPLSIDNNLNRKRGARLPEEWSPTDADRAFAKDLGWSESQIDSESANFRDYWIAKPGSGGCKLDWPATWRKWVRSSKVKPAGQSPSSAVAHISGFYAKADSEQLDAWDAHSRKTNGKNMPRDRNGGWRVEAEWPPDYAPTIRSHDPPQIPKLHSMS